MLCTDGLDQSWFPDGSTRSWGRTPAPDTYKTVIGSTDFVHRTIGCRPCRGRPREPRLSLAQRRVVRMTGANHAPKRGGQVRVW
jgi:hypothetical protein